jgi:hypothetical protein
MLAALAAVAFALCATSGASAAPANGAVIKQAAPTSEVQHVWYRRYGYYRPHGYYRPYYHHYRPYYGYYRPYYYRRPYYGYYRPYYGYYRPYYRPHYRYW